MRPITTSFHPEQKFTLYSSSGPLTTINILSGPNPDTSFFHVTLKLLWRWRFLGMSEKLHYFVHWDKRLLGIQNVISLICVHTYFKYDIHIVNIYKQCKLTYSTCVIHKYKNSRRELRPRRRILQHDFYGKGLKS